jgi:hypothetical protein
MDIPLIARIESNATKPTFAPRSKLRLEKFRRSSTGLLNLENGEEQIPEAAFAGSHVFRTGIQPIPEVAPDEFEQVYQWFLS